MKHTRGLSIFAAFSVILSVQSASAATYTCAWVFSSKEQKALDRKAAADKKAVYEALNQKALDDAKRENRPSVDINARLKINLSGEKPSPWIDIHDLLYTGQFDAVLYKETKNGPIMRPSGKGMVFEGQRYIEFPNSTVISTRTKDGRVREWILTRGIRPYRNKIDRVTGEQSPQNYISDLLLSEVIDGKAYFHSVYLRSEKNKKVEDPRWARYRGKTRLYLTDYSSHVPKADNPNENPDVMNRYIESEFDENGVPLPPKLDPETGKLPWKDLSPAPVKRPDGKYRFVDAKNGTMTTNYLGESVAITRFRPDFTDPYFMRLFNDKPWNYAIQSYIFKNAADAAAYDWRDAMIDLAGATGTESVNGVVRPALVSVQLRDSQQVEHTTSNQEGVRILKGKKGTGPGPAVLHMRRVGDLILGSYEPDQDEVAGPHEFEAEEFILGRLTPEESVTFPVKDGERVPTVFPHDIRKLGQMTAGGEHTIRHYDIAHAVLTPRLDQIRAYRPGVIEADTDLAKGLHSGILDLVHRYLMGYSIAGATSESKIVPLSPETIKTIKVASALVKEYPAERARYESLMQTIVKKHGIAVIHLTGGESDSHTMWATAHMKDLVAETLQHQAAKDASGKPDIDRSK